MTDSMTAPSDTLLDGKAAMLPPLDKPVEPRPIKIEDLEDYVLLRRDNESEDLRKEYRVRLQMGLSLVVCRFVFNRF